MGYGVHNNDISIKCYFRIYIVVVVRQKKNNNNNNNKFQINDFFFFWIGSKLLLFINYLQKQLKILINYILQPHYTQVSKKKKMGH